MKLVFAFTALILGGVSLVPRTGFAPETAVDFPGWPPGLVPADAQPEETTHSNFVSDGSSYCRLFVFGSETWLVRWLPSARRNFHPIVDCFRAQGYALETSHTATDAEGVQWQEFFATRDNQRWRVRQRWLALDGTAWTDVSSWFWGSREHGTAYTVVNVAPVPLSHGH